MKVFTPLLFLVVSANAAQLVTQQGNGLNPVARIVQLLESLKKKMLADKEADQSAFEKYECWCETMKKAKTNSIQESKDEIANLEKQIQNALQNDIVPSEREGHDSAIQEYENKIKDLKAQNEENTAQRNAKIQELTDLVAALDSAVETLEGGQPGAALMSISAILSSSTTVTEQAQAVADIMQAPDAGRRNSKNTQVSEYESQTGGLISQLKKMSADMSHEKEDTTSALEDETNNFESMIEETETLLGTEEKARSDAKHLNAARDKVESECNAEIDRLNKCIEADEEMLQVTNFNCEEETKRFNHRIEVRDMELKGFAEAMSILASDDARDTFNSSFESNFVQLQMETQKGCSAAKRIHKATGLLASVRSAYKLTAALRKSLRGPSFTGTENIKEILGEAGDSIIKSIDEMVAALQVEIEQDEASLRKDSKINAELNTDARDLSSKIDELGESRANQMATAKEELAKQIGAIKSQNEIKHEMQLAQQAREEEKTEAARALADDNQAVELLAKAIGVLEANQQAMKEKNQSFGEGVQELKEFGRDEDAGETEFIQIPEVKAGEKLPPPPETAHYDGGSHDGEGKGVVAVLTMIKEDIEKDIDTSAAEDADAQKEFVKATEAMETELGNQVQIAETASDAKNAAFAAAGVAHDEIVEKKKALATTLGDINTLASSLNWKGTHTAQRKANFAAEIEALNSAKVLLGGNSFLQKC